MSEAALLQLTTVDGYLMLNAMQVALAAVAAVAVTETLAASAVVALVATAPLVDAVASSVAGGACTAHIGCASAHHCSNFSDMPAQLVNAKQL